MLTSSKTKNAVSVIIPTYNAGSEFQVLLEQLWKQTLRPMEIIVIDSSSQDGTREIAQFNGADVYVINQEDYDHGGTRNYAASMAKGSLLVFMTQDAVPNNDLMLENLTRPLINDSEIAVVYARQIAKQGANLLERLARSYNYPDHSILKNKRDIPMMGLKAFFCSNVCSAIRKETFMQLGQFPEPVIFNEDMFFAAKCVLGGYTIAYTADAEVLHSHNYSLKQLFRRYFDNGVSIRMNNWLNPYLNIEREGTRLVNLQLKEIVKRKQWRQIVRLFGESCVKYIGFQLGKRYKAIPSSLCVRLSMHRKIWVKLKSVSEKGISING